MSAFSMEFVPGTLAKFGDGLVKAVEESVRPAAQAGSQVLYDQVLTNVNVIKRHTGNLARSIYQVYSDKNKDPKVAIYAISWNNSKAPHGWLVENGYLQRYEVVRLANGRFATVVRPEMRGKKRPRSDAPVEQKLAYFMPRKGGPVQVPARSFLRRAFASKSAQAQKVMEDRLWAELKKRGY